MATGARAGFTRRFGRTFATAASLAALTMPAAAPLAAQPPPAPAAPSAETGPADEDEVLLPDIEITATVHWKQLRFDVVGQPAVEFSGTPERKTVWDAERINLPRPVQPGVTYRDGGVRLTISSQFAALSRLYSAPEAPGR